MTLNGFDFKGSDINEAAKKSWTVKYYNAAEVKPENLVEPSQAGTYKAVVTLPGSAYWTEHRSRQLTFTIEQTFGLALRTPLHRRRSMTTSTDVNIVEVILNDADDRIRARRACRRTTLASSTATASTPPSTGTTLSQTLNAGEHYFEFNTDFSDVRAARRRRG